MSRRRRRNHNHSRARRARSNGQASNIHQVPGPPRRRSNNPFRAAPVAPPPPPPPSLPPLPPPPRRPGLLLHPSLTSSAASKIKIDIHYSSRHYRVYLPAPGSGTPRDAGVELVYWDEAERMQWEHECPRVLFRRASVVGCIGGGVDPMEWRKEPDLRELAVG